MKLYVIQECVNEILNGEVYGRSEKVSKNAFVTYDEALDCARKMAIQFALNGWIVGYYEGINSVNISIDTYNRYLKKTMVRMDAYYTICEVELNLDIV